MKDILLQVKVEQAFLQELKQLPGLDSQQQSMSLIALSLLLQQLPEPTLPEETISYLPEILVHVRSSDVSIKRNACAVLTGLVSMNEELWSCLATESTVSALLAAVDESGHDEGVLTNVASALGALAQGGDAGATLVAQSSAVSLLVSCARAATGPDSRHACVDAICAVATHDLARERLVSEGAIEALAAALGDADGETRVRGLMGLAMLLPSSQENIERFSALDGALLSLMELVKSDQDQDSGTLSRKLLALVASNAVARENLSKALRSIEVARDAAS